MCVARNAGVSRSSRVVGSVSVSVFAAGRQQAKVFRADRVFLGGDLTAVVVWSRVRVVWATRAAGLSLPGP